MSFSFTIGTTIDAEKGSAVNGKICCVRVYSATLRKFGIFADQRERRNGRLRSCELLAT